MVRILIERYCRTNKEMELESLLIDLRAKAMRQYGYISGETIRDVDDPLHWVTISTWTDADLWKVWETSYERREIAAYKRQLLVRPEKKTIFTFTKRAIAACAHTIDR